MKEKALKDFWVRMESGSSTVTGSFIYLKPNFPNGKKEPEIVFDCGTFLTDEYKVLNKDFICNPSKISYVFVTHEHIDHMGRLAGFYHQGYSGKVYASEYTVEIIKSTALKNYFCSKRKKEEPVHDEEDAMKLINSCRIVELNKTMVLDENVEIIAYNNAHTKGAVMYKIIYKYGNHRIRILITGDYKKKSIFGKSYFPNEEKYDQPITIITEATNGAKNRPVAIFEKEFKKAIYEGKSVLCSIVGGEKFEDPLYIIKNMQQEGLSTEIPIYLEVKKSFSLKNVNPNVIPFNFNLVNNSNDRKIALYESRRKIIIISNNGAIQYYLPFIIGKESWTIFFLNHSFKGSLAERFMVEKGSQVKIGNKEYKKIATVFHSDEFSLHYYIDEIKELINGFTNVNAVFLGHGESESKEKAKEELKKKKGLNVLILKRGEAFKIYEDKVRHSK